MTGLRRTVEPARRDDDGHQVDASHNEEPHGSIPGPVDSAARRPGPEPGRSGAVRHPGLISLISLISADRPRCRGGSMDAAAGDGPDGGIPRAGADPAWITPGAYEVAPGVHRIPLPLPSDALRAVNVYAIEDEDGL